MMAPFPLKRVAVHVDTFLAGFTGPWVYAVIGSAVGLASIAPPGWFIPGQTFALTGGVMASAGLLNPPATIITVFGGATIGCAIGYALGALWAAKKPGWKPGGRVGLWWEYAMGMLATHIGLAILTGRWNAALRACVPNAAGAAKLGWRRFLAWNALACAIWSPVLVGVGMAAYRTATMALTTLSAASTFVLMVIAVFLISGYRKWGSHEISQETSPEDAPNATGAVALAVRESNSSDGDLQ